MLILKPENNLTGKSRYKNAYWELRGTTPNEEFQKNPAYRSMVSKFIRQTGLPVQPKWFEVRIVKDNPSEIWTASRDDHWYSYSSFMDKAFWMFMKPVEERVANSPYLYYVLEPEECVRVQNLLVERHGFVMPKQIQPYIVPVECCSLCWDETVNGYSEHLHWRPEITKTQQQVDREERIKEESAKLLSEAIDISDNTAIGEKLKGYRGRLDS